MVKEKTPEDKLVDKLVGAGDYYDILKKLNNDRAAKNELCNMVIEAWKNGASVDEIQKVYDENLLRLQKEIEDSKFEKPKTKINSKWKEKIKSSLVTLGCLVCIIFVIAIIGLFTGSFDGKYYYEEDFEEVNIGGVTFNIHTRMNLQDSGENEIFSFRDYFVSGYNFRYEGESSDSHRLYIEVYKNKSVEQVLSMYKSNNEMLEQKNTTIGNYSGIEFNLKAKGWDKFFLFEKNGKTVVVSVIAHYPDEFILNVIS